MAEYEPVIGIETHVQYKTKSKIFCGCGNDARVAEPNTLICPICLGMPGTLPVLNEQAVLLTIRAGIALNGEITHHTKFDRKNYFYPDSPKGYQITQFDQPLVGKGWVEALVDGKVVRVGITRAHLEEDAGKLVHPPGADYSLVDLNRAGTPLLEIVSEPDMRSPAEAKAYVRELYLLMKYAGVSEVDLYHGNMRFDVNVSVRPRGSSRFGTRSETKNLNSFRAVEQAAAYEIKRQVELLEKGEQVIQETRGWDEAKGKTTAQRSKEEAHDYRYFPEPDLPPLMITDAMIESVKADMPRLPAEIRYKLSEAGIDKYNVETLLENPQDIDVLLKIGKSAPQALLVVAKYLTGKIRSYRNQNPQKSIKLDDITLVKLATMQSDNAISSSAADEILVNMIESGEDPEAIAKSRNLLQVSDSSALEEIVGEVVKANPKAAEDYKAGNQNSLQFLVGQVMKASRGQANPQIVGEILRKQLN